MPLPVIEIFSLVVAYKSRVFSYWRTLRTRETDNVKPTLLVWHEDPFC